MSAINEVRLHGIAQLIVNNKLLAEPEALELQHSADASKQSFLHHLINSNLVPSEKIAYSIAKSFGMPLVDLDCIDETFIPRTLINEKLIRHHGIIPLFTRTNHLFLATDDPSAQAPLKEIQFHTRLSCTVVIVETLKLTRLIKQLFYENEIQELSLDAEASTKQEKVTLEPDRGQPSVSMTTATDDAPIVKFLNKIIVDAIKKSVSDIHFEPYEHHYRIRYRLDGVLTEVVTPAANLACRISSRIKVMANLDIAERRLPQDGHFKISLSPSYAVDLRVSTCPTINGEKVVLRILDPDTAKLDVDTLGFTAIQKNIFLNAISKPQGMLLVTGPTGSGKTVTLYTALDRLNKQESNILTVEDPVEIKVPGINQININPKIGLTFASSLRAFLRQDPDTIMVGEIRDFETAEIAINAAQTGHFVLSTLHTNSAAETLTRLLNMGIPSFNVASSLKLIIAQRLLRKLCNYCKVERSDLTRQSLLELGFKQTDIASFAIYRAQGCDQCNNGYSGRVGLFEVMPISQSLTELILANGNSLDILKQAQDEGMLTIYQAGLEKIKDGITSIEEVNRVTVPLD
ncbi:MAG: type IV-A pilus assembly ATPase PilB [Legionellales bacterium RIFCSPHIGHO2_12_FULL_42_9]|nr:MAG: type IV-A pilus assembly ATPase PilB [Legionellales bacterium RIFCSPHIGHO2_12_FULL_42_9]